MGSWYIGNCRACGFHIETGYEADIRGLTNHHESRNAVITDTINNHKVRWIAHHQPITRQEVLEP